MPITSCVAGENALRSDGISGRRSAISRASSAARSPGPSERVGLVHAERREHLGDRLAVARRVLAHVETGEVEAEHLDLPDRVVQLGHGDELAVPVAQQPLGEPQVGEQLARRDVAARVAQRVSRARARATSEK